MATEQVLPGVYKIGMGYVNAFLLVGDDVAMVDSGLPNHLNVITEAIAVAGRKLEDLKHALLTHHHADHTGSLSAVMVATGAQAYIHPLDAPIVRGEKAAPGPNTTIMAGRLLGPIMQRLAPKLAPITELQTVNDGERLDIAGGVTVVHTPGHTAGHVAYLWPEQGGVLFAGDAAGNVFGLGAPTGMVGGMFTEDIPAARESFRRLAELEFSTACFGHGGVIKGKAHAAFRRAVERLAK